MRARWLLIGLVGCGRVAFAPLADSDNDRDSISVDGLALPAEVCSAGEANVGVSTSVDLVATSLTSGGIAAAWVPTASPGSPVIATFDAAGRLVHGPRPLVVAGAVGTSASTLIDLDNRLYLVAGMWPDAHQFGVSHDLTTIVYNQTLNSMPSRECVSREQGGTRTVWLGATGTVLFTAYVGTVDGPEAQTGVYDTGDPLDWISCQDGPDHVHVGWTTAAGVCEGANITLGATTPNVTTVVPLATDCFNLRAVTIDYTTDDSSLVWTTSTGTIRHAYVAGATPDPSIELTATGRAVRTRSDGTNVWFAWIDTRTGTDELRIGHKTLTGSLTDVALTGITPAGDESFELVRSGTDVHLIIMTTTGIVRLLRLCT